MKKLAFTLLLASLPLAEALALTGDFVQSADGTRTVRNTQGQSVTVTANPTGANVRLNAATSTQPPTVVASATGASLNVTPQTLTFGNQVLNTSSAAQLVTLSNTGAISVGLTGQAFTVSQPGFTTSTTCGATLAPGASCTTSFVFKPTVVNTVSGTYEIRAKQARNPVLTVSVSGMGLAHWYRWVASPWTACSNQCGSGTQTRSVSCQRNDGLGYGNATCSANRAGTVPVLSQSCFSNKGCP